MITHHAPTPRSLAPHFEGNRYNAAFASNLENLIKRYQPMLWVRGHMHDPVDVEIGSTRVLCNPAGYDARESETRGYNPVLCIEIDAEQRSGEASADP